MWTPQRHYRARRLACHWYSWAPISSKSLSFSSECNSAFEDYQTLYRFLETCKLSLNSRTATETHARIITSGYGSYPSLVACLMSTYARCDRVNLARQLLDRVFCGDFDLVSLNIIIACLMKNRECDFAKKVFYKMSTRDVVTWNSLVGGFVKNERFQEALRFFRVMLSSNIEPDPYTFASVINGCARFGSLKNSQWVHALMIEKKVEQNSILTAALIDMYSKCGRIQTAKEVFDSISCNDVSVWNAMINGLASHGLGLDAIALFSKMELENVLPDSITFIGILTACSHCGLVEQGRKSFDFMRNRYSVEPQLQHYGTMVDLFSRAGFLEEAYAIIDSMPMEPDIVIWRSLLSACKTYKNPALGEIAIANISRLRSGDYVLLSNIYCSVDRWDTAERVREKMKKTGVRKNRGKSWVELGGVIHQFKAGDRSHPEAEAIYRVLGGLVKRIKLKGFTSVTELVLMDVSEEEKEENLSFHSEKLAVAYGFLKTSPGTEIRIFKNLRICHDCHCWIKVVSTVLNRVIIVRDRIRFHRFDGGLCSCGDYW